MTNDKPCWLVAKRNIPSLGIESGDLLVVDAGEIWVCRKVTGALTDLLSGDVCCCCPVDAHQEPAQSYDVPPRLVR